MFKCEFCSYYRCVNFSNYSCRVAIYNNKHKKDEPPGKTVIVIPPPVDPLSGLRADTTGIRDIDEEDINSSRYVRKLATRLDLLKNPQSQVDVFYEEESNDQSDTR